MEVDNIITLADGKEYGLLLESDLNNNTYFLAVQLDKTEQPTNKYKVLKKIEKEGKTFVVEETDPIILNSLLEDFSLQADDEE